MTKNTDPARPRHAAWLRPKQFTPEQITDVVAETRAFSLLVAQTKAGNGTACYLLGELFGSDPLERVA